MRNLKLTALGALACILLAGCAEKDDIERKVDELLSKMTLREKIGQMHQVSGGADLAEAAAKGDLGDMPLAVDPRTAVTVMLVSGGYPGAYPKGKAIKGTESVSESILFHAGTAVKEGSLVTSGGRVIAASSYGVDIPSALECSFRSAQAVDFDGKYFRRDIGRDLL